MSKRKNRSNKIDAIEDMADALRDVFKKYTLPTRREAWKRITSKKGEKDMRKLLTTPTMPLNQFRKLNFKEWIEEN